MSDRTWTVTETDAGVRLDKFLADPSRLTSRGRATDAIAKRKVFVNDTEVDAAAASGRLSVGDRVRVWMDRPGSAKAAPRSGRDDTLRIVYEDDELLVADKPPGLLTVPLPRRHDEPVLTVERTQVEYRNKSTTLAENHKRGAVKSLPAVTSLCTNNEIAETVAIDVPSAADSVTGSGSVGNTC